MEEKLLEETLRNNIMIVENSNIKDQMFVWIEEMSELTKVICKWARIYEKLDGNLTGDLKQDFLTEVADVTVCLDQIKYAVKIFEDELLEEYKFKVDRQLNRIERGEE